MKINEVEAQVGITKKNIRFYEEQGLLSPPRGANGYREYGEAEVETLRRIRLMRKLGVPLEEIRRMQAGEWTVGDGMRRHLVTLERQRKNVEQSEELCRSLKDLDIRLDALDAGALLEQMEQMEQTGIAFPDPRKRDIRPASYLTSVVAAAVMCAVMIVLLIFMAWSFQWGSSSEMPFPIKCLFLMVPLAVILGVLLALRQRILEIQKGEMNDAQKY